MVPTNFWIRADSLGIEVFLLCSLILSLCKKKNDNNNSQSQFVALPKPTKKASDIFFASCTEVPGGKKKPKMLYIFHITCCKVLICEALIKTMLNDLWIAISHSAFLLFYTFFSSVFFVFCLQTNCISNVSNAYLKTCLQLTIKKEKKGKHDVI